MIPVTKRIERANEEQIIALHPIGRLGTREEVAELIVWLGSGKPAFVTGSYYPIRMVIYQDECVDFYSSGVG
ncbi:hypothetical protein [Ferruginibacter sp.]|uniref:hypothetical protein n=1 Tax=Ferruginibacter sp. TaxID=1940288 RepID=UPI0026592CC9|nr:hypothetical protein [Ferruginibacter sp.]